MWRVELRRRELARTEPFERAPLAFREEDCIEDGVLRDAPHAAR